MIGRKMTLYEIITIVIAVITIVIALMNYSNDIKQKRLSNTIYFINSFEHKNDWFSNEDRKNWNKVINSMNQTCAKFSFSDNLNKKNFTQR